jgi:Concanavalin A-like lectin/glucanases superfamily
MKRFLLALTMVPLLAATGTGYQSIPMGALPVATGGASCLTLPASSFAWKTTEGSGMTAADTASGNTLTLTNVTWSGAVSPLTNTLVMNGTSAYGTVTSKIAYGSTQPWSVLTWVASTTHALAQQVVFSSMDATQSYAGLDFTLHQSGSALQLEFAMTSSYPSSLIDVYSTCTIPSDGTIHQVGVTYDGSKHAIGVNFYIDGALCPTHTGGTDTLTGVIPVVPLNTVGARPIGSRVYLTGKIGNMLVTPSVLTSTQISCLYSNPYGY